MLSLALALAISSLAGPPAPDEQSPQFEELEGFKTVVLTHINNTMGSEKLPAAMGQPVEPGVFVTITKERIQIFDRNVATLQNGVLAGAAIAAECRSRCPAVLFNAFSDSWASLAFEAAGLALEIPTRMLFAVDAEVPATTLLHTAYAAGETRPMQPPYFWILLNGGRAGLRSQPVYFVPPEGLDLPRQTAALGLTVTMDGQSYNVAAADAKFGRRIDVTGDEKLVAVLTDIKKRYPSKDTLILAPRGKTTVGGLIKVINATREKFPYVVLKGDQIVRVR